MIETHIQGIPCKIKVTYYYAGRPMHWGNTMADAEPEEHEEIEFEVYDRKGYKANWLENKLTETDVERIHEEIRSDKNDYDPH